MLLTHRKLSLAQLLPLGVFTTLAVIAGCDQSQDPANSGSVDP
jgi:hypothetical protein